MRARTGYHYTSWENWTKIKKEGLRPGFIMKPEFLEHFGRCEIFAIWIWRNRLKGKSHTGSVLYQVATKKTPEIVLLEVKYYLDNCMAGEKGEKGKISVSHTGRIGGWDYHDSREKAYLIKDPIPPARIKLVKRYNILKLIK